MTHPTRHHCQPSSRAAGNLGPCPGQIEGVPVPNRSAPCFGCKARSLPSPCNLAHQHLANQACAPSLGSHTFSELWCFLPQTQCVPRSDVAKLDGRWLVSSRKADEQADSSREARERKQAEEGLTLLLLITPRKLPSVGDTSPVAHEFGGQGLASEKDPCPHQETPSTSRPSGATAPSSSCCQGPRGQVSVQATQG